MNTPPKVHMVSSTPDRTACGIIIRPGIPVGVRGTCYNCNRNTRR